MTDEKYHAIKDHISASGLKAMRKSPAYFRWLISQPSEDKTEFRIGSAVHLHLLEPDLVKKNLIVADCKGVAGPYHEAKKEHPSKVVITQNEEAIVNDIVKKAKDNDLLKKLLLGGRAEMAILGEYEETKVKAKIDYIKPTKSGSNYIVDLKTIADLPDLKKVSGHIYDYGYHIQAAWYMLLTRLAGIEVSKFIFVFLSKKAPYECAFVELSDKFYEKGEVEMREQFEMYKHCEISGEWPSLFPEKKIVTVDLPYWVK